MAILQVKNLNKSFGDLAAVRNLSFEVERGEVFGISGPNGSGKTTLFNLITGMLRGSGEIIYEGLSINELSAAQVCHRGIARTFQITLVFPTMTVFENVKVGVHFGAPGATKRNLRENIDKTINLVGLRGKEDAIAANLNLFDKKMTMLAIALATEPRLLLLDEPAGGLSPTEIRQFIQLIQTINTQLGITIIVIEHLMKVIMTLTHRLMILHNGEKLVVGYPREVAEDTRVREIYLGTKYA